MRAKRTTGVLFVVSLVLMLVGSLIAGMVQRDNGNVAVSDITFVTEDGAELRALLYIPDSANPEVPVPGVVTNHGYNNTAELQGINAIELARRGLVVLSIDAYGHGKSTFPDPRINEGIVTDMGAYAGLQYLGRLPYVDRNNIGMVGHSMGSGNIQEAAFRAFELQRTNPEVVVPHALLITSNAFLLNTEKTALKYADHPVNVGVVFGQFDQWAQGMWGVPKGSQINQSAVAEVGMGFANPEFETYYRYGNSTPISRDAALDAAAGDELRIIYSPAIDHPSMHFSAAASAHVLDYFDVTLMRGENPIAASHQTWFGKEVATGLALVGFFLLIPTLGLLLLRTRFFGTIVRPEPESLATAEGAKGKLIYAGLLVASLVPAPFVYMWATGYPIAIKSSGRVVPTIFPANDIFPMPIMNGLVIFNAIAGLIALAMVGATVMLAKRSRATASGAGDLGVKIPGVQVAKALLLAITVVMAAYFCLMAADFWFTTDFRFYVFSVVTLTPAKVLMFLKYLPFFAFYFILSSLSFNMTTRIRGAKEWVNVVLIVVASAGSLAVLAALDAIFLFTTGVKLFLTVPYPEGTTAALAGVLLWGLLFILPIAAVYARLFFKKTGSIWVGGFINSLVVTFFALSNTVVAAGVL